MLGHACFTCWPRNATMDASGCSMRLMLHGSPARLNGAPLRNGAPPGWRKPSLKWRQFFSSLYSPDCIVARGVQGRKKMTSSQGWLVLRSAYMHDLILCTASWPLILKAFWHFSQPYMLDPYLRSSLPSPITLQGAGLSWLFPFVDGHPPIGWGNAVAYLIMPALLVASQYASMKIISPPQNKDDPAQQQTQVHMCSVEAGRLRVVCCSWRDNGV